MSRYMESLALGIAFAIGFVWVNVDDSAITWFVGIALGILVALVASRRR